MVNVKVPDNPAQKRGLWPLKGGREIPVLDSDDWSTIAAREHLDVGALRDFNFHTHVPVPRRRRPRGGAEDHLRPHPHRKGQRNDAAVAA